MSSATSGTSRGDATRRSLLEAATIRFARDGFRSTSVADVSRDAGVGGTTAYVHFANKEALFLAAVDDDLTAMFEQVIAAIVAFGPDSDWPTELFSMLLGLLDEHPLARRLLAGLEPTITDRVLDTDAFAELRRTIAGGLALAQSDGQLRPDLEPALLADGLVSVAVAVTMATVQIGDRVLEVFGPGLAALFRGVLEPDPRLRD